MTRSAIIAEVALICFVGMLALAIDEPVAGGAALAVRKTRAAHAVARFAIRPIPQAAARLGLWSALAGIAAVLLSPRDASFHKRAGIACVLSCAAIACESYAEPVEPVEFTDDEEEEEIDD